MIVAASILMIIKLQAVGVANSCKTVGDDIQIQLDGAAVFNEFAVVQIDAFSHCEAVSIFNCVCIDGYVKGTGVKETLRRCGVINFQNTPCSAEGMNLSRESTLIVKNIVGSNADGVNRTCIDRFAM